MTKTTAECLDWLDKEFPTGKDQPWTFSYAIRAQLLAAQEVAKALDDAIKMLSNEWWVGSVEHRQYTKALTAYCAAGGK